MRTTSTKNISKDHKLKLIVYGESGSGKTTLVGTIKEPVLLISAEGGALSLDDKDINMIDIATDDEGQMIPLESRVDRLGEVYSYLISDKEARSKYKWICIDSLTEVSACLLKTLDIKYPDPKMNMMKYGEFKKRLTTLIKSFRDLPYYNVMFTALTKLETDKEMNRFISIDVVGSLSRDAAAFYDGVLYLAKTPTLKQTKRVIVTGNDPQNSEEADMLETITKAQTLISKVRAPNGGGLRAFELPDMQMIIDKIRGNVCAL